MIKLFPRSLIVVRLAKAEILWELGAMAYLNLTRSCYFRDAF